MSPSHFFTRGLAAFPAFKGAVLVTILLPCLSLATLPGVAHAQAFGGAGGGGPTEVGVVSLQSKDVPYSVTLPGRAVAHDQTEVRPRVEGIIEDVAFTPGATVKAGDVLFRLDTDTYETALDAAKASKASAEASLSAAQSTVTRYTKLNGVGFTQADLDTAQATLAQAKATLSSAEASLTTAQQNLDRTVIRSPIDGIVDLTDFSVGALVTANQTTALTTVTRIDPIYVDVQESSARMLRVRDRIEKGSLKRIDPLGIQLTLETGDTYKGEGRLVSPRVEVSTTTGTVDFRIEFENPDRLILPGQFLRVQLTLGTTQGILVPQRATSRSSDGALTAFLASDGVAKKVTLTSSGSYQNAWIVTDGVQVGDQLIVDGLRNLKAGAKIKTVPVTIDENGLVTDTATADSATTQTEGAKSGSAPRKSGD